MKILIIFLLLLSGCSSNFKKDQLRRVWCFPERIGSEYCQVPHIEEYWGDKPKTCNNAYHNREDRKKCKEGGFFFWSYSYTSPKDIIYILREYYYNNPDVIKDMERNRKKRNVKVPQKEKCFYYDIHSISRISYKNKILLNTILRDITECSYKESTQIEIEKALSNGQCFFKTPSFHSSMLIAHNW